MVEKKIPIALLNNCASIEKQIKEMLRTRVNIVILTHSYVLYNINARPYIGTS